MRPSHRREMARQAVAERSVPITLACEVFKISETCYRYQPKKDAENALIERWLIRLTDQHTNWGFGLCFLYLRNQKKYRWNRKRVYRIYCELELNMRIHSKKRVRREKPEALSVPEEINQVWSNKKNVFFLCNLTIKQAAVLGLISYENKYSYH